MTCGKFDHCKYSRKMEVDMAIDFSEKGEMVNSLQFIIFFLNVLRK